MGALETDVFNQWLSVSSTLCFPYKALIILDKLFFSTDSVSLALIVFVYSIWKNDKAQAEQFPFMAESSWIHNDGANRKANTPTFGYRVKYKLASQPLASDRRHFWRNTWAWWWFGCQSDCFQLPVYAERLTSCSPSEKPLNWRSCCAPNKRLAHTTP